MGLVGINIVLGAFIVGAFGAASWLRWPPVHQEPDVTDDDFWFLGERIKRGEMGDDIPIGMADAGCDYELACQVVFSGQKEVALHMLQSALNERRRASPTPSRPAPEPR